MPAVSIGLPVYNGSRFLRQALDSLLAQDFTDFELIAADNGSTDDTLAILTEYAARDSRLRVTFHPKNLGAAANFAYVFREATAPYFMWAAHDDVWAPSFVRRCLEMLQRDETLVLAMSEVTHIDQGGAITGFDPNIEALSDDPVARAHEISLRFGWFAAYGLMRRTMLERTNLIGPKYGSDVMLLYQLAVLGKFGIVKEPLFFYRMGAAEKTAQDQAEGLLPGSVGAAHRHTQLVLDILETVAALPVENALRTAIATDVVRTVALENEHLRRRIVQERRPEALNRDEAAAIVAIFSESSPTPFHPVTIVPQRKKLVVATAAPLRPARSGRQARTLGLYGALAKHFDIEVVSLAHSALASTRSEMGPGFSEITCPTEAALTAAIAQHASDAACLVLTDPGLLAAVRAAWEGPLVFEAGRIETIYRQALNLNRPLAPPAPLEHVRLAEAQCCMLADLVVTSCEEDRLQLIASYYAVKSTNTVTVPDGIDVVPGGLLTAAQRGALRSAAGLGMPSAVFVGGDPVSNSISMLPVSSLANAMPDFVFLIVGTLPPAIAAGALPQNVRVLGELEDAFRDQVVKMSDVALNPAGFSTGLSRKVLEYLQFGTPTLSAPIGMRGLGVEKLANHFVVEFAHFPEHVRTLAAASAEERMQRAISTHTAVVSQRNWPYIALAYAYELLERSLLSASCSIRTFSVKGRNDGGACF